MSRLRWLLFRRRQDDDLAREMEAHLAERADDLVGLGASEADARAQARRELGNTTLHRELSGDVWRWQALDVLGGSLRDARRTVRRSAATIAACLLVLGVSTGLFVTAAVIADNLLLRPIRLPGIDRVVGIGGLADPGPGWTFDDWWGQAASVEKLTRWSAGLTQLATSDGSFLVNTAYVEPAFPDLFPTTPILGRALGADDFVHGSPVPIVISEGIWSARFRRDPDVVGAVTTLSSTPVVIVGVLPTLTAYRHDVQIWVPRKPGAEFTIVRPKGGGTNARLAEGATVADARRDIELLGTRLNTEQGAKTGMTYFGVVSLGTITDSQARPLREPVIALVVSAFAVLVMAAANVATLLLNLVVDRRQELAVKASLGATRRRLVGQLGLESALVGWLSGVVGGMSGAALLVASRPLLAPLSPYLASADAVWVTFLAGVGLGTVLGLVVGLVPLSLTLAWRDWSLLQYRGANRGSSRGRRVRSSLVVVQVTTAMMLVTVASAAIQAFITSNQTSMGFDLERVLAVRLMVPAGSSPQETLNAIAQNARAAGLVDSSASADRLPVVDRGGMLYIGPQNISPARILLISPGFMRTMGIPLLEGREFAPGDTASAVISETLARRFWPNRSALGEKLQVSQADRRDVIGVVGDIQEDIDTDAAWGAGTGGALVYGVLSDSSDAAAAQPQTRAIVMRCRERCDDAGPAVRAIVEAAGATIIDITSLQTALEEKVAPTRLRSMIAVACGVFGLLLALTGIYGIVRLVASSRVQEVNIRMALGASAAEARAVIFRYAALIVFTGVVVGSGFAWLALSASRSLFFSIPPSDPASYLAAATALVIGGLLACLGPALRLGRLDARRLHTE